MHRRVRKAGTRALHAGVGGFHVLDEIGMGLETVLDVDDLAPLPALLQPFPGVEDLGGAQLLEGGLQGLEVVVGAAVGQKAAVALDRAEQHLVGIHEAGVGIVVREPFVQPAGELRGQRHQDAVVELAVGQLVDALGDQRGQAGHPGHRSVVEVFLARHARHVRKDRRGVNGIVGVVQEQGDMGPGQDVDGALDLIEAAGFAARFEFLADHLDREADPAFDVVRIVETALLVGEDFADHLFHELLVGAGIEIDVALGGFDGGGLDRNAAGALKALAVPARGIDEAVLVDRQALLGAALGVLAPGRDGVFRDRVPKLDGVGKLRRFTEERREEIVLETLRGRYRRRADNLLRHPLPFLHI
jgi:hypothetical protein